MKYLIKSIMAGVMISVGGTIYLLSTNKIIGALFFGIGLFMVLVNELNLYTGKIGYVVFNKTNYWFEVLITLMGNIIGTVGTGLLLLNTRIATTLISSTEKIVNTKLNDNYLSIFILSLFCGILMYLAVNGYKTIKDNVGKYLVIFLCVAVFILSSYEHCIANMFYFTIAKTWSLNTFLYLLIMIIGNGIGAITYALATKYINK